MSDSQNMVSKESSRTGSGVRSSQWSGQACWRMVIVSSLLLAIGSAGGLSWLQAAQEKQTLKDFMRLKLDASSKILEGLAVDDSDLIGEGAKALLEMSKAEKFKVLSDPEYLELNREFRSAVHKLEEAAKKSNLDNATLQWFDTVKSCVECHKYVRTQKPAKSK